MSGLAPRVGLGVAVVVTAMFLFASMDAVNKHLSQNYSIFQILWVRFAIFACIAALLAQRIGFRKALRSRRPGFQFVRSALLVGEIVAFIVALRYLPLADVHAIAAASPLIATALSGPLLGETVGRKRWIAIVVGFLGVLVVVRPGFNDLGPVLLIPLLGGFLFALYQLSLRYAAGVDTSETTVLFSAVIGLAAFTCAGPFVWRPPSALDWTLMVVGGALGSAAHYALTRAFEFASASSLQPFTYALMVWATLIGFVAFGQFPDAWTLAGAALIVATGIYAARLAPEKN